MKALVRLDPLAIVRLFGDAVTPFEIEGLGLIQGADVGWTDAREAIEPDPANPELLGQEARAATHKVVALEYEGEQPSPYHVATGETLALDGDVLTVTRSWGEPADLAPIKAALTDALDAERDARVRAGFTFGGVIYQSRDSDRENISGAALAATIAVMLGGGAAGNLRWHVKPEDVGTSTDSDFVWIAADNSLHPMDAPTMIAFGQAAMAHKQLHIFAAREAKDAVEAAETLADALAAVDGVVWP